VIIFQLHDNIYEADDSIPPEFFAAIDAIIIRRTKNITVEVPNDIIARINTSNGESRSQ